MDPASQGSSLTEGKRSKRSKKGAAENGGDSANTSMSNATSEADTSASGQTAADIDIAIPKKSDEDDDDDGNWTADVSEEAVRARLQDLTEGAKSMTISELSEKSEKERMDIFYETVKQKRDAGQLDNVQVHKELAVEADRLDVAQKAPLILAELLFSANITQEVRKYRNLLLRFTHNNLKGQRYLIGGLEQIIALHANKLMDKVAGILKLFYDSDILEEKALIEWSQKVSKKYVSKEVAAQIHEKAKPFIQWLQEAEEEESDEDEDDSDVEIEYNERARVEPLKKETVKPTPKKVVDDDDGEEIDIDEI